MRLTDHERLALNAAMDRYADGEDAAFVDVYDLLAPRLLAYFARQLSEQTQAEDIVQQTLLQMHAARRNYVTRSDVLPWAFAIGRNLLIDTQRRGRRELRLRAEIGDAMDVERAMVPDGVAATAELAKLARAELKRLPEAQRAAYELVRQEGLSIVEAAAILGVTTTAVKLRLHRAYEALRNLLTRSETPRESLNQLPVGIPK